MSKVPETITIERKMHHKSYRFIWFAHKSWGFMQGERRHFFKRFWPAWRKFDALVLHDLNGCPGGCCECDQ